MKLMKLRYSRRNHSTLTRLIIMTLMLTFLLMPVTQSQAAPAQDPVTVTINGRQVDFTNATGYPFVDENNRTLVPFRATLETFGAQVYWNNDTRTAAAIKNGTYVEVPVGLPHIFVNGSQTPNDTSAVITSEGRTYLPIRKVMEAFGAQVTWDSAAHSVNIHTDPASFTEPIGTDPYPPDLSMEDMEEALKNKVTLANDQTLFTLYAFLNYTGYEDENSAAFHPVRTSLLEDLYRLNLDLAEPGYYTNRRINFTKYLPVTAELDSNLRFINPLKMDALLPNLSDLDRHLREFSEKADIPALYQKYNTAYMAATEAYQPDMYTHLAEMSRFLQVTPESIPAFTFQVNLLESHWRAYWLSGSSMTPQMIIGPSRDPNWRVLTHEYLHGIVTPVNLELSEEINTLSFLMAEVPVASQATNPAYNDWFAIFDESVVRALDAWFLNPTPQIIQTEVDDGFILTGYFHERFKEWEDYDGTLEEFIRSLIQDLHQEYRNAA